MPALTDFHAFGSTHWETGTLAHALAYQGVVTSHDGRPISEALLLGISGGIAIGYFSFAYEGYDPHVALLTRNTFDPFPRMCERLGVAQDVRQTASAATAADHLRAALEEGHPALVWADVFSLPYNHLVGAEDMWSLMPVLVYAADGAHVLISDRAGTPLEVSAADFAAARGRTKKNRHRMLTVELASTDKLARAAEKGIHDCISLFLEAPPKGARHNFGLAALDHWADLLVKPKPKAAWVQQFPPGPALLNGLVTAFSGIELFGTGGRASRPLYADFLGLAADLLAKPGLREAAAGFRHSADLWGALARALLPEDVPPLGDLRTLLVRRHETFCAQGTAALDDLRALSEQIDALRGQIAADFPLDDDGATALRESIRERVLALRDAERAAVEALEAGMQSG